MEIVVRERCAPHGCHDGMTGVRSYVGPDARPDTVSGAGSGTGSGTGSGIRSGTGPDSGPDNGQGAQTAAWRTVLQRRLPTTFHPVEQCRVLLQDCLPQRIVATGYGRELVQAAVNSLAESGVRDAGAVACAVHVETITEIKAHALGAAHEFAHARTVLDIGGQDTKAIALLPPLAGQALPRTLPGRVSRFEMNDRCAAGTGKFLEYTATVFQMDVQAFGRYALEGDEAPLINSMCTVFAETEATSLMAQGIRPQNIALGLHQSIVRRTVNMLRRVGLEFPVVFTGGVARNPCMRHLLQKELGATEQMLLIPAEPDMTGALGAALWGCAVADAEIRSAG